ncbi:MAG: hypothetical protein MUQ10_14240 [Anaerolineae bacterium]|nr:hypothetical protein [Anaerolineae bacterium]
MASDTCLVLYGDSVFLAGIRTGLARDTALDLVAIEDGHTGVTDVIRACHPRAVFFDLAVGQPEFAVTLLRDEPGLLLIGVDPSSNEILILSGRPKQALTLSDLLNVIDG